ncbi:MAG: hypothetical protein COU46_01520 [Candidatus Niyogibacteria bacterium CG10_big_fil_rev_8_21_14_0_10_42_19]|uniref:M23ase beta-sheet core domain-containing protein n=1 Tax=Candidatus Niyogibacteria bacterium CG10_big_fil_rev_8_21_14_0_10_42_19 TaxID=1974725 RepID=A0A2H0TFT9_9BACT|nr:MAG: hypothetical protein COU46_01520 [Candidatus Niyogibacteria bacterium CG10_big_fil_rev_8_21_14_0_10_42_19]
MKRNLSQIAFIFVFLAALSFSIPDAKGASLKELRSQLEERGMKIEEIEKEIQEYKEEIDRTSNVAASLSNEVKKINAVISKLSADTRVTEQRIDFSELNIEKLTIEIENIETGINSDRGSLAELLRSIDDATSKSFIEILLANVSLSYFFDDLEYRDDLQGVLQTKLQDLRRQRTLAEEERLTRENEKLNLISYQKELSDRKKIEQSAKDDKAYLLNITKNEEKKYQKLLDERLKMKEALEEELKNIEQEIRIIIDPASLPPAGPGVLGWPLTDISLKSCYAGGGAFKNCVTQFFGNTDFATTNPQIYNNKGHNGIDFRAPTGTQILTSREGIVRAVGDTDAGCRGVSYGKWILIDHPNNLSTLYAHLSRISVGSNTQVNKGQVIGYSGMTGYSTGPHLHFTVYASQAVEVSTYRSKICGTLMEMPLSPANGYLNPLSYL